MLAFGSKIKDGNRYHFNEISVVSPPLHELIKFMPEADQKTMRCEKLNGAVLFAIRDAHINSFEQITNVLYLRQKEKNKYILYIYIYI